MSLVRRRAAFAAAAVLVALLGLAAAVGAQDTPPVRVSGSAIAAPLVESVAAASGIEASLSTTGTTAGLAALCAGEADLALASRPLTAEEEAACAAAGVEFYELLIGHTAAVVIANSASPPPSASTPPSLRWFSRPVPPVRSPPGSRSGRRWPPIR